MAYIPGLGIFHEIIPKLFTKFASKSEKKGIEQDMDGVYRITTKVKNSMITIQRPLVAFLEDRMAARNEEGANS
jgi:hypothetical protein